MDIQGSISSGTMRPEDLIPTFADTLKELDTDGAYSDLIKEVGTLTKYDTDEADFILSDLFDALDALAPAGCYFGAHPGDGADYGFWEAKEV
jgi:hypothetical protein